MYKMKRIVAKIIDMMIIVVTVMFIYKLLDYFFIGTDNPFIMIPTAILLVMILYYIYFGILGSLFFDGSIGKKIVGLVVVDEFNNIPSINKLFLREPVVEYNIINIFIILTGMATVLVFTQFISSFFIILFSLFIFLAFLVQFIYLIFFLANFDFWNKHYKIMTTEEYDNLKVEEAIEKSDF